MTREEAFIPSVMRSLSSAMIARRKHRGVIVSAVFTGLTAIPPNQFVLTSSEIAIYLHRPQTHPLRGRRVS